MKYATHINTSLYKAIENECKDWIEHIFFKVSVLSGNIVSTISVIMSDTISRNDSNIRISLP